MKTLSIIIKTLNEEENIGRCIESCLKIARSIDTEVIVADSGSDDATVRIAAGYPVAVVQVAKRAEGRCGAGPQLGYQVSTGKYLYLLDGDMELDEGFIRTAIAYLDARPAVAGFGGVINETRSTNLEFESRRKRYERYAEQKGLDIQQPHEREYLAGGALYRRTAVEQVGYLTDRNLHGSEEYDLGSRLTKIGWTLIRSHEKAVDHYSHKKPTLSLMWHRIRSGMVLGVGEIVRAAASAGYLGKALREVQIVRIALAVFGFWSVVALAVLVLKSRVPGAIVAIPAAGLLALVLFMTVRHRSLKMALFSVLSWHVAALGLVGGLLAPRRDPREPIAMAVLKPLPQQPAEGPLARAS